MFLTTWNASFRCVAQLRMSGNSPLIKGEESPMTANTASVQTDVRHRNKLGQHIEATHRNLGERRPRVSGFTNAPAPAPAKLPTPHKL